MRPIFKEGLLIFSFIITTILFVFVFGDKNQATEPSIVRSTEASTAVPFQIEEKQLPPPTTTTTTTTVPPTTTTTHYHPPTTVPVSSGAVNWDAIAECESHGNWHINTGNGYYGGLQFDLPTWRGTGGTGYPHEHSREEQIYRAEILYSNRGLAPWPVCGKYG